MDDRKPLCTCPVCGEKRYSVIGCWGMAQHIKGHATTDHNMSDYELPQVDFTKEELTYLQDLLTARRSEWFNYYEALVEEDKTDQAAKAHDEYLLCKKLRNKLYHMNGRDTLAPGNHEQRWWDQKHDYE